MADTVIHIAPDCPAWAEEAARADAKRRGVPVLGRGMSDRQRLEVTLRAKSPMRAAPGRTIASQADAGHLPLFVAAREPGLFD